MPALNIVFGDMINAAAAPTPDGVADAMRSDLDSAVHHLRYVRFVCVCVCGYDDGGIEECCGIRDVISTLCST